MSMTIFILTRTHKPTHQAFNNTAGGILTENYDELRLLSSELARDDAVDEITHGYNQDSKENIEARHEAFGKQCIFCYLHIAGKPQIERQMRQQ